MDSPSIVNFSRTSSILFHSKVRTVEQKFLKRWLDGMGEQARFANEPKGWFVGLEGSWESLFVGMDEPDVRVGDEAEVRITFNGRL